MESGKSAAEKLQRVFKLMHAVQPMTPNPDGTKSSSSVSQTPKGSVRYEDKDSRGENNDAGSTDGVLPSAGGIRFAAEEEIGVASEEEIEPIASSFSLQPG